MFKMQSSRTRRSGIVLMIAMTLGAAGCEGPSKRLNAPPQGHTAYPHEMQTNYVAMTDNAMLTDMTMSSIHFVPHQSELNGTGVRRLQRYAQLMKIYGGTLHYDGIRDEKPLSTGRIARMEDFLVNAGLDREQFKIERGLAGGEGSNADEAIIARKNSYAKEGGGGGGAAGGGMSPGEALKAMVGGGGGGGGGK